MGFDIVLKEKPLDEGLTKAEVIDLYNMLSDVEAIPIEIQGQNSTAMGFINITDAEFMDYNYAELEYVVKSVINDIDNEHPDCRYNVDHAEGTSILYLSR